METEKLGFLEEQQPIATARVMLGVVAFFAHLAVVACLYMTTDRMGIPILVLCSVIGLSVLVWVLLLWRFIACNVIGRYVYVELNAAGELREMPCESQDRRKDGFRLAIGGWFRRSETYGLTASDWTIVRCWTGYDLELADLDGNVLRAPPRSFRAESRLAAFLRFAATYGSVMALSDARVRQMATLADLETRLSQAKASREALAIEFCGLLISAQDHSWRSFELIRGMFETSHAPEQLDAWMRAAWRRRRLYVRRTDLLQSRSEPGLQANDND